MNNDEFFGYNETVNDWMELLQKIKLNFLIMIIFGFICDSKIFSKLAPPLVDFGL
jgi:hypothetical protein